MRYFILSAVTIFTFCITPYNIAGISVSDTRILSSEIVEHGGGCRKSSPAGQCCHMDHSTGVVHCH
jgi:hypothetical protein